MDIRPLHRARASLHLFRLLVGPAVARLGYVRSLRPAGPRKPGRGAGLPLPRVDSRVLPSLHLRGAHRQDHLPEPLLLGQPGEPAHDIPPPAPHRVAGRPARSLAAKRDDTQVGDLGADGPGGRGVRVRGNRQAQPRLAVPRPAAAHLAAQQRRPDHRRTAAQTTLDGLRYELGGRGVRPDHRGLAAVASQQAVRLHRAGRVPRDDLAAIPDRHVPLDHDRRKPGVLPPRLAASHGGVPPAPSLCAGLRGGRRARFWPDVALPRWYRRAGALRPGADSDATAPLGLPRQRALERGGLSLRLACDADREDRARAVPGDGRRIGRGVAGEPRTVPDRAADGADGLPARHDPGDGAHHRRGRGRKGPERGGAG